MSSYGNSSGLRVGMDGTLSGIHFRVLGRVVLSTEEDGETYFWEEFHLVEDTGREATLVLEDGDNGPEWKLFMAFEPSQPLTAAEAAGKRVGDEVNLEDRPVRITYVGQSRVIQIEGQAPEGVEMGDVAQFFNADEGARMLVVSWTGDEVEYYRGIDVLTQEVRAAFNLPSFSPGVASGATFLASQPETSTSSRFSGIIVLLILVAVGGIVIALWRGRAGSRSAPRRTVSHVAQLADGKKGSIEGKLFTVVEHSQVEILCPDSNYDWHEYNLREDGGNTALLVGGLNPGEDKWFLFRPVQGEGLPSATQAASLRGGESISLAAQRLQVYRLFRCPSANRQPANIYGFLARAAEEYGLVRWSAESIECYLGRPVNSKEVEAAFISARP
jgi:hypothetical protein